MKVNDIIRRLSYIKNEQGDRDILVFDESAYEDREIKGITYNYDQQRIEILLKKPQEGYKP